jgi:flagellar basal-body rod protein FlgB
LPAGGNALPGGMAIRWLPLRSAARPSGKTGHSGKLARPLLTQLGQTRFTPVGHRSGARMMSDAASNQSLFGVSGMALELRSQRMGLLTSNIANAATPGYKARDIDFGAALKARIAGASSDQATSAAIQYRVPVMPSLDGNTVDTGTEQVAFSQNAVGYSSTLSFLSDQIGEIKRAIKGE